MLITPFNTIYRSTQAAKGTKEKREIRVDADTAKELWTIEKKFYVLLERHCKANI